MSPAQNEQSMERTAHIAAQLVRLLEHASRRPDTAGLPGLPGAKRPEEEVLVAA